MSTFIFGLSVSELLFYGGTGNYGSSSTCYGDMYSNIYIYRPETEKEA